MAAAKNTTKPTASTEAVKQIAYLSGALKAPRITEAAARLAELASRCRLDLRGLLRRGLGT